MAIEGAQAQITKEVTTWRGVQLLQRPSGWVDYRFGKKYGIGHIHGDHQVDIEFPTPVRHALVRMGKVQPHHALKDSGWVSFYIEKPDDVQQAIALLRRSYEIMQRQLAR